jgi:hypothetical protein
VTIDLAIVASYLVVWGVYWNATAELPVIQELCK